MNPIKHFKRALKRNRKDIILWCRILNPYVLIERIGGFAVYRLRAEESEAENEN